MPLVSVTRARIRRFWSLPSFIRHAVPAFRQAQRAEGFLGGAVLRDRRLTAWTMTVWDGIETMRAYMLSDPHRASMPKFAQWCDEASIVHWEQADAALPSWPEAERRMRAEGRPLKIRRPSPDHAALTFAPARTTVGAPVAVERKAALTQPGLETTPQA